MKSVARLFYGLIVFLGFMAVVYIFGIQYPQDTGNIINESRGRSEWTGVIGLVLTALMTLMPGGYLHFTKRRSNITPSGSEEVEIVDGVDTLGFSSVNPIWPFVVTTGILFIGYGTTFMAYWLIVLGAVILIVAGTELSIRYITPPEKH